MTRTKRLFFAMFLALATTFGFNPEAEAADATITFNVEYDISACGWGATEVIYTEAVGSGSFIQLKGAIKWNGVWTNWMTFTNATDVTVYPWGFEINDNRQNHFPFPCIGD